MNKFFKKVPFVDQVLRGMGQIMLQNNRWTGLLFLIGLFIGSWKGGLAALVATCVGTLTARYFHYKQEDIDAGIYGFSPALVGVSLAFLFNDVWETWVAIIIGSFLAAVVQHLLSHKKIPVPAFTFPFVVVAWGATFLLGQYTNILPSDLMTNTLIESGGVTDYGNFVAVSKGFGEVIFQGGILVGMVFFLAVGLSNPVAALYGLFGSLFGAQISLLWGLPVESINMGMFGFNAVLTAIALSGTEKSDGLWVVLGLILTIIIDDFLIQSNFIDLLGGVLTFPFVAGTWITLSLKKYVNRRYLKVYA